MQAWDPAESLSALSRSAPADLNPDPLETFQKWPRFISNGIYCDVHIVQQKVKFEVAECKCVIHYRAPGIVMLIHLSVHFGPG